MRSWILITLLAGCCADTYEITADRNDQPIAELVIQPPTGAPATATGTLSMRGDRGSFTATLFDQDRATYTVDVPESTSGTYTTNLTIRRQMQAAEIVPVTITTRDVALDQVCMDQDQNDYGTGRCGFSFVGTIEVHGTSATLGDLAGTWQMHQLAVVIPGTPDC